MDATDVYFIGLVIAPLVTAAKTTASIGFFVFCGVIMISIAIGSLVRHFTSNRG